MSLWNIIYLRVNRTEIFPCESTLKSSNQFFLINNIIYISPNLVSDVYIILFILYYFLICILNYLISTFLSFHFFKSHRPVAGMGQKYLQNYSKNPLVHIIQKVTIYFKNYTIFSLAYIITKGRENKSTKNVDHTQLIENI